MNNLTARALPAPTPEQQQELRQLLAHSPITNTTNTLKEGHTVNVVISTWASEEQEGCFDVVITAFRPNHERLRLADVPVTLVGEDDGNDFLHPGQSTPRGDLIVKNLRTGIEYEIHVRCAAGSSNGKLFSQQSSEARPDALAAASEVLAAAPLETDEPEWDLPPSYETANGLLTATVLAQNTGTTLIAIETNEPSLAGTKARFAFVEESGRIAQSGEVILEPVTRATNLWEGRWEGVLQLDQPSTFYFESLV